MLKPRRLATLSSPAVLLRVDAVADAGHGGDDPGPPEPLAQPGHRDADCVRERVRVLIPRPRQKIFRADDAALGGDENLEHCELLPGQRDVAAVAEDLAPKRIHSETCDLAHGGPAVRAPAIECAETKHELLEIEGLREVVVGAEAEPGGLVVETVGGSEHEDGHAVAPGDDVRRDLVAARSGNVAVEYGDVVVVPGEQLEGSHAVICDVCRNRFEA